jgi:peptidoglycan/LPS O-acetylase OafA/YrhL
MPTVLVLTLIFGFAIAAVSYGLVEAPAREALRRWEKQPPNIIDAEADSIAP